MSDDSDQLLVYADYVCPFCYLGRESLAQYQDDRVEPLSVAWHPFDLRSQKRGPDGEIDDSVDDGKDDAYFDTVRDNVARLRDQYDADQMLGIDEVPDVDSLDAQVASLFVQREYPEEWPAFDDALYRALWEGGEPIDDPDVLADLAEDVGVDGEEVRDAIEDDERRAEVFEQFEAATQEGVTGVPTFAYEGYAARGAVPPEQLRRLVEGE
ncbi:putative dithiol-disulfide isomerase involved in polyketide biosynthesis [Salinarchaeum sp. Harcht-Bsk1]|uniref:DsbA family oxidoreductase n=1 Tax=Salinarchaeum sp. Harcht-Bsk1 TaxID=1333523 RepID=UPI0003423EFD|nr:DsbA family protein [Salinarchaeum sp. Harcht-Bsk1]AGN00692.1 putative dithiol-disulfide isomerase involved in polyketide biosynthesis [Salinarchaeum sp. Harcht-Bsk1]